MKKSLSFISLSIILAFGLSCTRLKKPVATERRQEWILSMNDSIARYKAQADSATDALALLRERIAAMMPEFEHVSNPREVEGYFIFNGWKSRYPLSSTEVVARISEAEGFELIAALEGGVFNQIKVSAGGRSATSAVVPHDQALNYRAGNLNTVCFTGPQADSIGALIADADKDVQVAYLGGAKPRSLSLRPDARRMIAATWNLYAAQKESHRLEKMLPLLSRKVDLCRRMLNDNDSTK